MKCDIIMTHMLATNAIFQLPARNLNISIIFEDFPATSPSAFFVFKSFSFCTVPTLSVRACTGDQCCHSCYFFSFLTNCTPWLYHLGRGSSLAVPLGEGQLIGCTTWGGTTPGLYHLGRGRSFTPLCRYRPGCDVNR